MNTEALLAELRGLAEALEQQAKAAEENSSWTDATYSTYEAGRADSYKIAANSLKGILKNYGGIEV